MNDLSTANRIYHLAWSKLSASHPSRQKRQPLLGLPLGIFGQKIGKRRLKRLRPQDQSGLFGSFVALVHIAAVAGGDQVGPDGLASFGLGHDVIDGQVSFASAILTFSIVSLEDIGPVE